MNDDSTQPTRPGGRYLDMATTTCNDTFTTWNLDVEHVVIELHEAVTAPAPAIELHVVRLGSGRLGAFWLDELGRLLRLVRPGET